MKRSNLLYLQLGLLLICVFISNCSLNLEDPISDTRKIIDKEQIPEIKNLIGVWKLNSILFPSNKTPEIVNDVTFEILMDSSYIFVDFSNRIFNKFNEGVVQLSNNRENILFIPNDTNQNKIFKIKVIFNNNMLELLDTNKSINYTFNKNKPLNNTTLDSFLIYENSAGIKGSKDSSFWNLARITKLSRITQALPNTNYFMSLFFDTANVIVEKNVKGIVSRDTLKLEAKNDTLLFESKASVLAYRFDIFNNDTIRLWINKKDIIFNDSVFNDSTKYLIFNRTKKRNDNNINFNFLPGYWRGDSLKLGTAAKEQNHLGKYCDLEFKQNHDVVTTSNLPDMILISRWEAYSGSIYITYLDKDNTSKSDKIAITRPLTSKLGIVAPAFTGTFTSLTENQKLSIKADAFKRFPYASYAQIIVSKTDAPSKLDTLNFFHKQIYEISPSPGNLHWVQWDKRENIENGDVYRLILAANPKPLGVTEGALLSNQTTNFLFGFQYISANNTLLTIFDKHNHPFSIRANFTDSSKVVYGTITGTAIDSSNTRYTISGAFQYQLNAGTLDSKLFALIPVKK